MIPAISRARTGLLAALCAGAAFAGAAASAQAAGAQTASGHFISGPFSAQFSASRATGAAPTEATGTFSAVTMAGSTTLASVTGPVTCLDVEGNRMGLFYPISSSSPSLLSTLNAGVFLYLQLGPDGKPQKVTFLPVPYSHVTSCYPLPAFLPISSGEVTLTS